jgi:predicted esterase YcpF (UPF0227 family)
LNNVELELEAKIIIKTTGITMAVQLLYLHGFNSSPLSNKAELSRLYFNKHFPQVNFHCPQIASEPIAAILQLNSLIKAVNGQDKEAKWFFIGSSLGGYFSTYLSEKYQGLAALINPAVKPFELLTDYLGEQTNPYTEEVYQVSSDFIDSLKSIEQTKISKNNYLIMVQTDDEVLDYRQALKKYNNAQIIKQEGGDHSFIGYEKMLPDIAKFFHLS